MIWYLRKGRGATIQKYIMPKKQDFERAFGQQWMACDVDENQQVGQGKHYRIIKMSTFHIPWSGRTRRKSKPIGCRVRCSVYRIVSNRRDIIEIPEPLLFATLAKAQRAVAFLQLS